MVVEADGGGEGLWYFLGLNSLTAQTLQSSPTMINHIMNFPAP